MGWLIGEHDIFIPGLIDELNLRFAPAQLPKPRKGEEYRLFGGVQELAALQKEFKIFKKDRPLRQSIAVLNVAARNNEFKNRFYTYLDSLEKVPSNQGTQSGAAAIVNAIIKDLAQPNPLPVHFTTHDIRSDAGNRVLIGGPTEAVHFVQQQFITISLPMQPAAFGKPKAGKSKA